MAMLRLAGAGVMSRTAQGVPNLMALTVWLVVILCVPAADAGIRRLPISISEGSVPQINSTGYVVWQGGTDTGGEIILWNGVTTRKITGPIPRRVTPKINDVGGVLWSDTDGQDDEIYLWDGNLIRQITDNAHRDHSPIFNDRGQVAWVGEHGDETTAEIYLWDGVRIRQLTTDRKIDRYPAINNLGQVVWQKGGNDSRQIHLWDGATVRQLTNRGSNSFPHINDRGHVVWESLYPSPDRLHYLMEIQLWDGRVMRTVSSGDFNTLARLNDRDQVVWTHIWSGQPRFWNGLQIYELPYQRPPDRSTSGDKSLNNAGQVAWRSWDGTDWEIYQWNEGDIRRITHNGRDDFHPQLNDGGQIAWMAREAGQWCVYLYNPVGVSTLSVEPAAVVGGRPLTATVTLAAPASTEGALVRLASSQPELAAVPDHVVVPAGALTVSFPVSTSRVAAVTGVMLAASLAGEENTAHLTLLPP
jgi:hypothetical protein